MDYSNPLNIQLNISTRESGREIYVAGLFAVTLQCGLICIAAITVFHPGVKTTIGVEAEVYGFPCYVAGSVLLSAGIAFCSLAIEQTTEERAWEMCDKRTNVGDYPKLVFLQQDQRVQVSETPIPPPPQLFSIIYFLHFIFKSSGQLGHVL